MDNSKGFVPDDLAIGMGDVPAAEPTPKKARSRTLSHGPTR